MKASGNCHGCPRSEVRLPSRCHYTGPHLAVRRRPYGCPRNADLRHRLPQVPRAQSGSRALRQAPPATPPAGWGALTGPHLAVQQRPHGCPRSAVPAPPAGGRRGARRGDCCAAGGHRLLIGSGGGSRPGSGGDGGRGGAAAAKETSPQAAEGGTLAAVRRAGPRGATALGRAETRRDVHLTAPVAASCGLALLGCQRREAVPQGDGGRRDG